MKYKWKKKLCGAISIFLCIIFLSNYALVALLVDSARMRMAKSIAESSLDTATYSVISYYNQMLYDLYGLFSTDSLSEEKILKLLNDYTQKTMGVLEIDESSVKSLSSAIEDTLQSLNPDQDIADFELYDFNTQVELVEGDSVTLANTDAVESQIIDHMKYRAPYAMASEVGGFLKKMDGLFTIKERIEITTDRLKLTQSKESLFENTGTVMEQITGFETKVKEFVATPTGDVTDGADVYSIVAQLDRALEEAEQRMESQRPTAPEKNESSKINAEQQKKDQEAQKKYEQAQEEFKEELKKEYQKATDAVLSKLTTIKEKANELVATRNDLKTRWDAAVSGYQGYVKELEAKLQSNADNENYQTVYAPEIQQAKGSCGELLQRGNILLTTEKFSENISDKVTTIEENLRALVENKIEQRMEGASSSLEDAVRGGTDSQAQAARDAMEQYSKQLQSLQSVTIVAPQQTAAISLKKVDVKGDAAKEQVKVDDKKPSSEELRNLNEEDLKIEFETIEQVQWDASVGDTVDTNNVIKTMDAGINLISTIEKVLEDARDSLYINEYILAYFPNYVQHYAAKDKVISSAEGNANGKDNIANSYLIAKDRYYAPYNASQAEVEYVLTGQSNALMNMANISARLLTVRMILNTVAIFTDTAKMSQAQAMAAPSGPFAPLVSTGILVAWSLAESTLDTQKLLQGEEVELFKQGTSWTISVEGLAAEITAKVSEQAINMLNDTVNQATKYAQKQTNQIIYNVYDKATGSVSECKTMVREWVQEVGQDMQEQSIPDWPTDEIMAAFDQGTQEMEDVLLEQLSNEKEKLLVKANQSIGRVNEKITQKLTEKGQDYSKKAVNALSEYASEKLPVSSGEATNSTSVKLNYIDYIRIFLLFSKNSSKVQRIQQLIQANMRYGGQKFSMSESYVSVSSKMNGSIRFLMMSEAILPDSVKKDGRMTFTVYSRIGY